MTEGNHPLLMPDTLMPIPLIPYLLGRALYNFLSNMKEDALPWLWGSTTRSHTIFGPKIFFSFLSASYSRFYIFVFVWIHTFSKLSNWFTFDRSVGSYLTIWDWWLYNLTTTIFWPHLTSTLYFDFIWPQQYIWPRLTSTIYLTSFDIDSIFWPHLNVSISLTRFDSFWLVLTHLTRFDSYDSFWLFLTRFDSFWLGWLVWLVLTLVWLVWLVWLVRVK